MSNPVTPPATKTTGAPKRGGKRGKVRSKPKGRAVDPTALEEVRALLGDAPRRRDLLIEHLHKIQDRYQLSGGRASRGACRRDEAGDDRGLRGGDLLSPLRRGQGRRDRTSGHHRSRVRLDRLRAGGLARPAGEAAVAARSWNQSAARAVRRPLRDRSCRRRRPESDSPCDRRASRVGRAGRSRDASARRRSLDAPALQRRHARTRRLHDVPRGRRLRPGRRVRGGQAQARRCDCADGRLRASRSWRRRFSGGSEVEARVGGAGAPADGDQHRRGRAGHVQGSLLPRARSASLHRRRADRGVGGRHRRDLHLPSRRVPRLPRDSRARGCRPAGEPAVPAAGDPSSTRRRRVHLRRRVVDDRVDRGQPRRAAAASAVRRAGWTVRPSDARAQHGNAPLGARHHREGASLVFRPRPARAQGTAVVLGQRPREEARRAPRAGGHHAARAGRRVLRRHARRTRAVRLSAGWRVRRDPAGVAGRRSARLRHAQSVRLFHRLGGHRRAVESRHRGGCGPQRDEVLRRRVLRPVHAVPRRHGEGAAADG